MDAYDLSGACAAIVTFIDALNNWYIRRSRDRFWQSDRDAFDTLYTVLEVLCRVAAPLLPLTTEAVYRGLTGAPVGPPGRTGRRSDSLPDDPALVAAMDLARDVCSAALSIRKDQRLRVRLPLPSLTVAAPGAEACGPFVDLIADEVNVKDVVLTSSVGDAGELQLQLNMAVLGPRLGPDTQKVLGAVRSGDWVRANDGTVSVAGRDLAEDEYTLRLTPADPSRGRALSGDAGLVMLDTTVTPSLEAEGLARDVVRLVQVARKDSGLHVADRIHLVIDPGHHDDVRAALGEWKDYVKAETLAGEFIVNGPLVDAHRGELPDGRAIHIGLSRL